MQQGLFKKEARRSDDGRIHEDEGINAVKDALNIVPVAILAGKNV
jgi:hypothetical protein